MTATILAKTTSTATEIYYPDGDGKPMAESDIHRQAMNYCTESLEFRYAGRDDVYVAGNNFLYYRERIARLFISPDCYVVFGVGPQPRKSYKVWEEGGHLPAVVFEITSDSTRDEDIERKYHLYQDVLLIPEYILFDPTSDYIGTRISGFRLTLQGYEPIELDSNGRLHSEQLNLDFFAEGTRLRIYDPERGEIFLTDTEVRQRVNEEAQARATAEADNARLRAELEALRNAKA